MKKILSSHIFLLSLSYLITTSQGKTSIGQYEVGSETSNIISNANFANSREGKILGFMFGGETLMNFNFNRGICTKDVNAVRSKCTTLCEMEAFNKNKTCPVTYSNIINFPLANYMCSCGLYGEGLLLTSCGATAAGLTKVTETISLTEQPKNFIMPAEVPEDKVYPISFYDPVIKRVVVCGGWQSTTVLSKKCYKLNPSTNKWDAAADMPVALAGASVVEIGKGKFLVTGGVDVAGADATLGNTAAAGTKKTYIYENEKWTEGKEMPVEVAFHCSAMINANEVYIAGGALVGSTTTFATGVKTAYIYNIEKMTFTKTTDLKTARYRHGCKYHHGLKKVVITGGSSSTPTTTANYLTKTEFYDPATKAQSDGPDLPEGLIDFTMLQCGGRCFIVGGRTATATPNKCTYELIMDVWTKFKYSLATDRWGACTVCAPSTAVKQPPSG